MSSIADKYHCAGFSDGVQIVRSSWIVGSDGKSIPEKSIWTVKYPKTSETYKYRAFVQGLTKKEAQFNFEENVMIYCTHGE